MRTILVTGGAGYIGSHTCLELLNEGYSVVVVDNLDNSSREALNRVEAITGKPVDFYPVDVCDREALRGVFQQHAMDAVIHFAGLKAVGESVAQPLRYYRNNLDSTLALCEVMAEFDVRQLVFSSSATVYGLPERVPITEDFPTWCTNPYGWTKLMNEQILRDIQSANPGWSIVLLRYFNPIGAHESGQIGEDPSGIPNNLMPYISQVAVGRRDKLHVFGDDYPTVDGTGVRDYIHVVDLAIGHIRALEYAAAHTGTEAINLGTGQGYSVLEMVKAFEHATSRQVPYQIDPRRPGDVALCYADPAKASKLLGWQATRDLETMCRDTWRWQSQNPNGYAKETAAP
ncbi:MAG: UDP-glucose 4-epimerase GalE [Clostridia bacterium]|nr:UDP-glucose 4-epimerase GalE [Clostridia bacterium]NCC74987.1 UDP-glucose 4-epimerase GalE [Clostridia bacterium]